MHFRFPLKRIHFPNIATSCKNQKISFLPCKQNSDHCKHAALQEELLPKKFNLKVRKISTYLKETQKKSQSQSSTNQQAPPFDRCFNFPLSINLLHLQVTQIMNKHKEKLKTLYKEHYFEQMNFAKGNIIPVSICSVRMLLPYCQQITQSYYSMQRTFGIQLVLE